MTLHIDPSELIPSTPPRELRARLMFPVDTERRERQRLAEEARKLEVAKEQLDQLLARYGQYPRIKSPRTIIADVATEHKVNVRDIVGPSHKRPFVRARQHAMYRIATEIPTFSYSRIGHFFGDRHHTTVWWSIRAYALREKLPVPHREGWPISSAGKAA